MPKLCFEFEKFTDTRPYHLAAMGLPTTVHQFEKLLAVHRLPQKLSHVRLDVVLAHNLHAQRAQKSETSKKCSRWLSFPIFLLHTFVDIPASTAGRSVVATVNDTHSPSVGHIVVATFCENTCFPPPERKQEAFYGTRTFHCAKPFKHAASRSRTPIRTNGPDSHKLVLPQWRNSRFKCFACVFFVACSDDIHEKCGDDVERTFGCEVSCEDFQIAFDAVAQHMALPGTTLPGSILLLDWCE